MHHLTNACRSGLVNRLTALITSSLSLWDLQRPLTIELVFTQISVEVNGAFRDTAGCATHKKEKQLEYNICNTMLRCIMCND